MVGLTGLADWMMGGGRERFKMRARFLTWASRWGVVLYTAGKAS